MKYQKKHLNPEVKTINRKKQVGKRLTDLEYMLVTDIDNTLIGGPEGNIKRLMTILKENENKIGFAVADRKGS